MTDEVVARLDRIIFLMTLAYADQIETARGRVLEDPVAAAILAETEEEIAAGELKRRVVNTTGQSVRTVSRRIAQLAGSGWLHVSGGGGNVRYRRSPIS